MLVTSLCQTYAHTYQNPSIQIFPFLSSFVHYTYNSHHLSKLFYLFLLSFVMTFSSHFKNLRNLNKNANFRNTDTYLLNKQIHSWLSLASIFHRHIKNWTCLPEVHLLTTISGWGAMAGIQAHLHSFQAIWKSFDILISPSVSFLVPMLLSTLQKLVRRKRNHFSGVFTSK